MRCTSRSWLALFVLLILAAVLGAFVGGWLLALELTALRVVAHSSEGTYDPAVAPDGSWLAATRSEPEEWSDAGG